MVEIEFKIWINYALCKRKLNHLCKPACQMNKVIPDVRLNL